MSVAVTTPVAGGVFCPLRYVQSTNAVFAAPTGTTAIQSVGLPGSFATVIVSSPDATAVGVTVIVVAAVLPCTVIVALVATTV